MTTTTVARRRQVVTTLELQELLAQGKKVRLRQGPTDSRRVRDD